MYYFNLPPSVLWDGQGCYVYKYTDMLDNQVKYVGIVHKGTLLGRHKQHFSDYWCNQGDFLLEYTFVKNRSEAEALETHLISFYESDKWFNKAKSGWGINYYFPNEFNWIVALPTLDSYLEKEKVQISYDDKCTGQLEVLNRHTMKPTRNKKVEEKVRYLLRAYKYCEQNNKTFFKTLEQQRNVEHQIQENFHKRERRNLEWKTYKELYNLNPKNLSNYKKEIEDKDREIEFLKRRLEQKDSVIKDRESMIESKSSDVKTYQRLCNSNFEIISTGLEIQYAQLNTIKKQDYKIANLEAYIQELETEKKEKHRFSIFKKRRK